MPRLAFIALAAITTLSGVAVVAAACRTAGDLHHKRILVASCLGAYALLLLYRPASWVLIDVVVVLGAVGGALMIERGLRTPASVAVFLIVAAAVDVVSMSGGLSKALIDGYRSGASSLLLYLTLVVPVSTRLVPIVGIGDLVVGGAAAAALLRMGMRPAAVLGTFSAGLLAALAYGFWRGGAPAIPFIAVAVLVFLWLPRLGRLPKSNRVPC